MVVTIGSIYNFTVINTKNSLITNVDVTELSKTIFERKEEIANN